MGLCEHLRISWEKMLQCLLYITYQSNCQWERSNGNETINLGFSQGMNHHM